MGNSFWTNCNYSISNLRFESSIQPTLKKVIGNHPIKKIVDNSEYFKIIQEEYYDFIDNNCLNLNGILTHTLSLKHRSDILYKGFHRFLKMSKKPKTIKNISMNGKPRYGRRKSENTIKSISKYSDKGFYDADLDSFVYFVSLTISTIY